MVPDSQFCFPPLLRKLYSNVKNVLLEFIEYPRVVEEKNIVPKPNKETVMLKVAVL